MCLCTSLPGTWARSVTCRPSWKRPQRRSRRSRKRYKEAFKKHCSSCQQPARCLNTPLWLDRSFSQRFCDYSNHKKKKASFPWKRSPRKLQRNLHLNSRNQQRFRVKGRNCSFRLSALVFKGRVMYIKSMPCFRGFINWNWIIPSFPFSTYRSAWCSSFYLRDLSQLGLFFCHRQCQCIILFRNIRKFSAKWEGW